MLFYAISWVAVAEEVVDINLRDDGAAPEAEEPASFAAYCDIALWPGIKDL